MKLMGMTVEAITFDPQPVPANVAMVMSAMEAAHHVQEERRLTRREPYRTITQLRLFRDLPTQPAWELFTRDINRRGMGFITRHRLPLGYGGIIVLPNENKEAVSVHCSLTRCREAIAGWYEGSICFNREQPQFDI